MKKIFSLAIAVFLISSPVWAESASHEAAGRVWGKIQIVGSNTAADYTVAVVSSGEDLDVVVTDGYYPRGPGEWMMVDTFPDYTVRIVDFNPDFTIRYVSSFPGVHD